MIRCYKYNSFVFFADNMHFRTLTKNKLIFLTNELLCKLLASVGRQTFLALKVQYVGVNIP